MTTDRDRWTRMELYGSYTSPFVRHCRIALIESNLPFEFIEVQGADPKNKSPTRRVPYFEDGALGLSDSSSILRYLREKSETPFLSTLQEFDLFCLANTVLDTAINVFMFERLESLLPDQSKYLSRQVARIESGLDELEQRTFARDIAKNDAALRVGCLLAWGRFRKRFSLAGRPTLQAFLKGCDSYGPFADTAPPADA